MNTAMILHTDVSALARVLGQVPQATRADVAREIIFRAAAAHDDKQAWAAAFRATGWKTAPKHTEAMMWGNGSVEAAAHHYAFLNSIRPGVDFSTEDGALANAEACLAIARFRAAQASVVRIAA